MSQPLCARRRVHHLDFRRRAIYPGKPEMLDCECRRLSVAQRNFRKTKSQLPRFGLNIYRIRYQPQHNYNTAKKFSIEPKRSLADINELNPEMGTVS